MLDFQQKRKVRGIMYHPATLIILALLVLFFLHSTWSVYQKKKASESAKNISAEHLALLQAQEADLQAKIARLGTTEGEEEEIRAKFTVAKAGENMVIVVDNTSPSTTTPKATSFWQKLANWFK